MGEYADMILEGESCQDCGVYLGDAVGYPRTCKGCKRQEVATTRATNSGKTNCPVCNKRVKLAGLNDHLRDSHYSYWEEVSKK